ncbi:MAG: serine/threonine-protein phosphatase [Clostridia bacterium]|nr:serine/threonine-protein phosphatase [Clostridia bacterium]
MYSISVLVDIGVTEHQNDDRALANKIVHDDGVYDYKIENDFLLSAVCDGVGGLSKGFKAAQCTAEFLSFADRKSVDRMTLRKAITEANNRVLQLQKDEMSDGMRTTVAGVYIDENNVLVFNVGDSRVYRFRYKYLTQLSKDHSLVQDKLDMGEITAEEAKNHPQKNVITKCIGESEVIPRIVDFSDDLYPGDIFMICSDGASDCLDDETIKDLIFVHKNDETLSACCEDIKLSAIEAGAQDNISIVLIRKDF